MPNSELQSWLKRIESFHPEEIEMGLRRIKAVAESESLACLNFTCPVISVAGTNGKGSTVECLTQLALAHGLKVGTYTSPHLFHFNERIRLQGEAIEDSLLIDAFKRVDAARQSTALSFFEFTTLAALSIFQDASLDILILEVGLGGRLDAVNIVNSTLSVITSIGLDHEAWLGNSRELIAKEKAGIARAGSLCVIGEVDAPLSLEKSLKEIGALPRFINRDFSIECITSDKLASSSPNASTLNTYPRQFETLNVSFTDSHIRDLSVGSLNSAANPDANCNANTQHQNIIHQSVAPQNLGLALASYHYLGLTLKNQKVIRAVQNTQLKARFQIVDLGDRGEVIFDLTHNPAGAEFFVQQLQQHFHLKNSVGVVTGLFGVMADKDIRGTLKPLMPIVDNWLLCDIDSERAEKATILKKILADLATASPKSVSVGGFNAVDLALVEYLKHAKENDCLLVFGSFYTVAPALTYFDNMTVENATADES